MSQNADIKCKNKPSQSKIYLNSEKKDEAKKHSGLNEGSWSHGTDHGNEKTSSEHTKHESKKTEKVSGITKKQENAKLEKSLKRPEATQKQREKTGDACRKEKMEKAKDKLVAMETDKEAEDSCETPSMSFEAYLSYDLEPPKRKKTFGVAKNPKRLKTAHKENSCVSVVKSSKAVMENPMTTNFSHSYIHSFLADKKIVDVCEEAPLFIGQRLKNKMQVYSGSELGFKDVDCFAALYEIGGVPFEILEPVLERCTPEQLLRIEEYNPVYIGVTDHLWERHCQKDFRNAQLEEYESWREMYLRMSEERERKLKQLTKSIVSAHSGKPKALGNPVRIGEDLASVRPPLTTLAKLKTPERLKQLKAPQYWYNTPVMVNGVAPMMAKSLKAFKKQLSRR
ncbi:transcription elongation factor B polypeptide 3-like isoform X2 [Labeo rohita]|uniref:Transcription elongation factor B polypeptide 3-like isoform X2 n=1 Tax=Labeo rohita TaxID=84645 RepID=A0A498N2Q8_LABRO|nr:transcription elongation factor B polypeptide 3-like isoform X2 [Labeo rohita]